MWHFSALTPKSRKHLIGSMLVLCIATTIPVIGGCARQQTNIVFEVKFVKFLRDGSPQFEIQANGKPRPAGKGPFGDYYLVLRPDNSTPYARQFDVKDEGESILRDFRIQKDELRKFSRVTVAVENPVERSLDDSVILSNIVEIPID
ncbi:MAG: hypothetical protein AAFU85_11170 [Planctomycetota bacterium]